MENNLKKEKIIARKKGKVISIKMDKTVVVAVYTFKTHKKYGKKYRSTRKYKVHDPENKYKEGDMVEIAPMRPMGKGKKYKIA